MSLKVAGNQIKTKCGAKIGNTNLAKIKAEGELVWRDEYDLWDSGDTVGKVTGTGVGTFRETVRCPYEAYGRGEATFRFIVVIKAYGLSPGNSTNHRVELLDNGVVKCSCEHSFVQSMDIDNIWEETFVANLYASNHVFDFRLTAENSFPGVEVSTEIRMQEISFDNIIC